MQQNDTAATRHFNRQELYNELIMTTKTERMWAVKQMLIDTRDEEEREFYHPEDNEGRLSKSEAKAELERYSKSPKLEVWGDEEQSDEDNDELLAGSPQNTDANERERLIRTLQESVKTVARLTEQCDDLIGDNRDLIEENKEIDLQFKKTMQDNAASQKGERGDLYHQGYVDGYKVAIENYKKMRAISHKAIIECGRCEYEHKVISCCNDMPEENDSDE